MTSKTMYILQGVPGSGKSSVAKALQDKYRSEKKSVAIHSTDDFWLVRGQEREVVLYNFDPARLGEAHRINQQGVIQSLQMGVNVVIVDNTNITRKEARPYVQFAKAYGYDVQIIRVDCGVEEAIRRQQERPFTRRVPADKIREMYSKMENLGEEL